MKNFLNFIIKRKSADEFMAKSQKDGLKKSLGWFDLIILGVSAVIGSGIFVMIGEAACGTPEHIGAGPALVVSIVAAALACIFPAFCYAEFAASVPVAGGAYTYAYITLGECAAWMTGWVLMLEYAVSNITIAAAWTGYLFQLLKGFSFLPDKLINPPYWLIHDFNTASQKYVAEGLDPGVVIPHIFGIPISLNLPGILVLLGLAFILTRGMQESAKAAKIMVYVKMAVILLFAGVGMFYVKPSNWIPFAPGGFEGILLGTFIIFYAYLGFDAIATAAEETKEPQKNLPIGIIGTLLICSVVYAIVAIVFTGIIPSANYGMIDLHAPIAHAIRIIHQDWVSGWISLGALAGLTSVLLVLQYATSRILYSMARDNFLPKILRKKHPKFKTPYIISWMAAILVIIGSFFIDMSVAAQLCIFGTLTSFILVCAGILIMRKNDPYRERPFKVPFCPWFPLAGIFICVFLMLRAMPQLEKSALLFPVWLFIGFAIYILYGFKQNRAAENKEKILRERYEKRIAEKFSHKTQNTP